MIRKHPQRKFVPRLSQLESRRLLASSAQYLGLNNLDVAGPTAAVGPGGYQNLEIELALPINNTNSPMLKSLNITGPSGFNWTYGTTGAGGGNPEANPMIAMTAGKASSDGKTELFDAYFSPVVSTVDPTTGATVSRTLPNNHALSITIGYVAGDGSLTTETPTSNPALIVKPTDLNQTLTDATQSLSNVTIGSYSGTFQSQTADGYAHIQITGLPTNAQITQGTAELSDIAGRSWNVGATYGRNELGMTITEAQGGTTADIAFPPERDEVGTAMTLRFQLNNSTNWYVTDVAIGASQHIDPNLRSGGPIDPKTPALVVSPTTTTNLVAYTDDSGRRQTIDFQKLLDSGPQVITLAEGTYNISESLTINSGLILQGVDPNVELNFVGLPTIPEGVINFHSSHITLDQFKIRFADPTVNFSGGNSAIISDEEGGGQTSRVDLNIENLDIQAPAYQHPPVLDNASLAVPTTYLDYFDSGTIQNNTVYGGPIKVQGGPWQISGNHVLGAVKGALSTGAFAVNGGHDILLFNNVVSDNDPTAHGAIDRFFDANNSGFGFDITGNHVGGNVGLIAAVPNGSPPVGTTEDPRNNPEEVLFESYGKIFEGNVNAIGVSSSTSAGDNRRVISIPNSELAYFSGFYGSGTSILTVLDGPGAGQQIHVTQAFPQTGTAANNTEFLLDSPLPAGSYDFDIEPAYINLNFSKNDIDTTGTVSTSLVLASSIDHATVTGNTFTGDQSSEYDGNHNLLQSQAIRVEITKAKLSPNYLHQDESDNYETYNVTQAMISDNVFVNAVGGIKLYVDTDNTSSTTSGRTYGFVTLLDNQFQYSYSNPSIIGLGTSGHYSKQINNIGVVPDASATIFADPRTFSLSASGNTVQWTGGVSAPAIAVSVNAAKINGILYEANATPDLLKDLATVSTVRVPLGTMFNTIGITDDNKIAVPSAGFDGFAGNTYSYQSLLPRGDNTLSWNGQTFNIGAPGTEDVDSLGGVGIIPPAGQYATMMVLGASTFGDHPAQFTIFYSDGTATQTPVQFFSDWAGNQTTGAGSTHSGESIVETMSDYNSATDGNQRGTRYLYGYSFTLDPTKTVTGIGVSSDDNIKLLAIDLLKASGIKATVANSGFEAESVGSRGYIYNPTGSAWVYQGESGVTANHTDFTGNSLAPQGDQVAFLQQRGTFSQAIAFGASGSYQVSFQAAQREIYNTGGEDFQVLIDGNIVGTFKPTWVAYRTFVTNPFTVAAGSHTLRFVGLNSANGDNTAFIDNVQIDALATLPVMVETPVPLSIVVEGFPSATGPDGSRVVPTFSPIVPNKLNRSLSRRISIGPVNL